MLRRTFLCLAMLSAAGLAATSDFLLGLNYTEWGPVGQQIAADSSGALYILSACTYSTSCLTKLSADGKTILWQNSLGFVVAAMAVDPNGGIYLIPAPPNTSGATQYGLSVEKLSADGSGVLWTTPLGTATTSFPVSLTVDSTGRAFIGGEGMLTNPALGVPCCVVRLNATGAIDATFTNIPGEISSVAVDPTGSDVVIAMAAYPAYTFARLAADNSTWVPFTPPLGTVLPSLAVAGNGDAVVYGGDLNGNRSLQRIDPAGAVVFSQTVPSQSSATGNDQPPGEMVLDAAGNAYIIRYTGAFASPVKNSLAPCGSTSVGVYAPDGSVLQTTYLPGATVTAGSYGLIAIDPNADVFVLDEADATFAPTQTGPFPSFPNGPDYGAYSLFRLTPNLNAPVLPLACVGSAASYATGPIAPGETVTLFGNGLGPQQGVQTSATLQNPYPTQAQGVEVTFDGTPAALLWVQDSQINLAVPWSVAGQTTQICVTYNGVKTNCLAWPVAPAAPGVYTLDGIHAAALNQDGTLNSPANPAPPNSIVSVWATGFGPVSPLQADGSLAGSPLPINTLPLTLQQPCASGLLSCPVPVTFPYTYAGPAPLLVSGTSQINFNSNAAIVDGGSGASLYLAVQTGSGIVTSNYFQIYVAAITSQ